MVVTTATAADKTITATTMMFSWYPTAPLEQAGGSRQLSNQPVHQGDHCGGVSLQLFIMTASDNTRNGWFTWSLR
jgi:hypothetical protein